MSLSVRLLIRPTPKCLLWERKTAKCRFSTQTTWSRRRKQDNGMLVVLFFGKSTNCHGYKRPSFLSRYSPCGRWLCAGNRNGTIDIYRVEQGTLKRDNYCKIPRGRSVEFMDFASDSSCIKVNFWQYKKRIAFHAQVCTDDNQILVYRIPSGSLLSNSEALADEIVWHTWTRCVCSVAQCGHLYLFTVPSAV